MSPRPTAARSFRRDRLAWAAVLTLLPLALGAGYLWTHRRVLPAVTVFPDAVADPHIVALAYERVVTKPDDVHVDPQRLRDHLDALRAAGFQPVTLTALHAYIDQGHPLPAKSLLLTFDHGYLSTYDVVDPLLREMHWPATIFLTTHYQEARDPGYLYWDRLQRMVDSGIWEIGSHGHRGHDEVVVSATGERAPFFLRRMWLDTAGRVETIDEFAARLDEDYRRGKATIDGHVRGAQVLAYAPPLANPGLITTDPEIHDKARELVQSRFLLTFSDDRFGVNGPLATPYGLRRLRVSPQWTGAELVERLTQSLGASDEAPARAQQPERPARWAVGSGELRFEGTELVVKGTPRADVWRAGSQWFEEWEVEADLRTDGGQFWLVQQDAQGLAEWRFGGDAARTYLQIRRHPERIETLAQFPTGITPGTWHHLKLAKRGCGVCIEWDGRPLVERPAYLPGRWMGPFGLVTWENETRLRLANLRFATLPYRVRTLAAEPSQDDVQAAIGSAGELAALSPLWLELQRGTLKELAVDRPLLAILSRRYGWEIVPTVRIVSEGAAAGSAGGVDTQWMQEASRRLQAEGWSGIYVDVRALSPSRQRVLAARIDDLVRTSSWRERRILLAERRRRGNVALDAGDASTMLFLPPIAPSLQTAGR
jgi:peptidoglycan/xylan/chitin deacetylase (PgdA/CDA1 family)